MRELKGVDAGTPHAQFLATVGRGAGTGSAVTARSDQQHRHNR
ncbi:hypothetical protein ACIBJF_16620 [Streptomyces sp. NPDC050743]